MRYCLNEEQQLLQDSARKLLDLRSPAAALREMRDRGDASGFSRQLWSEVAELGWSGILVPEPFGGVDLGYVAAALIAEECGRTLAALPFLSTAVAGATALVRGGSTEQQRRILPGVAAGTRILALAVDEQPHHAPGNPSTVAIAAGGGYRLSGSKAFVLDGHVADWLIVSARTEEPHRDGNVPTALFLVDPASSGVHIERTPLIDSRGAADIRLSNVHLGPESRLGADAPALLESVLDAARALLAAELTGMARECLRRTAEYLSQRKQFGRPLAQFQALQHRLAHLFCEIELATSLARSAAIAMQDRHADAPVAVSAAKAKCAEVAILAANEAVQMHGGIGMTDELDIGLFLKRIRCASETYGGVAFHLDRVARTLGF